jgi:hypothetical protein
MLLHLNITIAEKRADNTRNSPLSITRSVAVISFSFLLFNSTSISNTSKSLPNWIVLSSCCSDNMSTSLPMLFNKSASIALMRSCLSDTDSAAAPAIDRAISYLESAPAMADLAVAVVCASRSHVH